MISCIYFGITCIIFLDVIIIHVAGMQSGNIFKINPDDILRKNFKFFIYDLPSSMNDDIVRYANQNYGYRNCMSLKMEGMGDQLFTIGENHELSVRNTDQFALEVIIHKKLMKSSHRTLNQDKADLFYIPAYVGTHCIFYNKYYFTKFTDQLIMNLTEFIESQKYYREGKPHFSTISKIHREMASEFCPYLQYNIIQNVTFLSIEKGSSSPLDEWFMKTAAKLINVIPYPSFVHLNSENIIYDKLPILHLDQRDVFIFLAAGGFCSNDFRCRIMERFSHKTKLSYEDFKRENLSTNTVLFEVTNCDEDSDKNLVLWMQRSVFCLQPPGDSPTRKSFYDSITSGCIPVIFGNNSLQYAFSSYLDFTKFTISIPTNVVEDQDHGIMDYLKNIDLETIQKLHKNLLSVIKYMQYSISNNEVEKPNDAFKLIFAELIDNLLPKT